MNCPQSYNIVELNPNLRTSGAKEKSLLKFNLVSSTGLLYQPQIQSPSVGNLLHICTKEKLQQPPRSLVFSLLYLEEPHFAPYTSYFPTLLSGANKGSPQLPLPLR